MLEICGQDVFFISYGIMDKYLICFYVDCFNDVCFEVVVVLFGLQNEDGLEIMLIFGKSIGWDLEIVGFNWCFNNKVCDFVDDDGLIGWDIEYCCDGVGLVVY